MKGIKNMEFSIESINTRDYCITCWIKDISQEELKAWLFANYEDKILKYTIGNTETTEKELSHFHVYIKFKNPIRARTLVKSLNVPSTHFEKMNTNMIKCHNYCLNQAGCYESNISNELINDFEQEKDVYQLLAEDIFENNFTMYEVCRKYPKISVLHYDNVLKLIQTREKQEIVDFQNDLFNESFDFIVQGIMEK